MAVACVHHDSMPGASMAPINGHAGRDEYNCAYRVDRWF
jgi:hypothetical protein